MAVPARLDRLERVTDLVLVLLNTPQPLTLDGIAQQVPGYPAEHAARRQAFERDKRLLRDEGIPVRTERVEGNEQYGYRIDRDAFYLRDLELAPDEQVALHLAVAGVHLGDPSGRDALLKLGASGLSEVRPLATLVPPPALIELFEAVRTRAVARFDYRGERRAVAPVGVWFRFGHWYAVAWDLDREDVRTFRVDRVEGDVERDAADSAEVPTSIDVKAALPDEPWHADGDAGTTMRIAVDALEGPRVAEEVGHDKVVARHPDGSIEVELTVSSFVAIRSWVLGLLDHAEVMAPAEYRQELSDWLTAVLEAPPPPRRRRAKAPTAGSAKDESPRLAPGQETSARLRTLLAIVGWLAQVGEAPLSEVAARFNMAEEDVVHELELAACCGVPPYTPDALMEIEVFEATVRAYLPAEFARPRRLTPAEGFAVAASARLLLAVPGSGSESGPLSRALAKLDDALGAVSSIGVDVDAPSALVPVRRALDEGRALEIDYVSASRDELTTRVIEPVQVVTMEGHWYLDAFCHRAGDMRRFRVDRISAVRPADQAVASRSLTRDAEDSFVPGPGAVEVHLRLGPGAQWVPESIPVRDVVRGKNGAVSEVVLDVGGLAWFERLLLQLGTDAQVVGPPDLVDLGPRAAERVLAVYKKS